MAFKALHVPSLWTSVHMVALQRPLLLLQSLPGSPPSPPLLSPSPGMSSCPSNPTPALPSALTAGPACPPSPRGLRVPSPQPLTLLPSPTPAPCSPFLDPSSFGVGRGHPLLLAVFPKHRSGDSNSDAPKKALRAPPTCTLTSFCEVVVPWNGVSPTSLDAPPSQLSCWLGGSKALCQAGTCSAGWAEPTHSFRIKQAPTGSSARSEKHPNIRCAFGSHFSPSLCSEAHLAPKKVPWSLFSDLHSPQGGGVKRHSCGHWKLGSRPEMCPWLLQALCSSRYMSAIHTFRGSNTERDTHVSTCG